MELKDYIYEAISSGKSKYAPEPGCSIEEMTSWLDSIGISGRIVNGTYKDVFDIPKDKPTYAVVTGTLTFPWLSVQNKFGQRVTVSLAPSDNNPWADILYSKSRPTVQFGFREGIECIERMAKYPEKRLQSGFVSSLLDRFSGESYTIEAISSKSNSTKIAPDVDLDNPYKIIEWLEGLGFKRTKGQLLAKNRNTRYRADITDDHRYTIAFQFVGSDGRLYYGDIKCGAYDTYRLLDVNDPKNPFNMMHGFRDRQQEGKTFKEMVEFIEEYAKPF